MAIELQHGEGDAQSRYLRLSLAAGDIAEIDFRGPSHRIDWAPAGPTLQVTPGGGATVAVTWAFRPDYAPDSAEHFRDHELHPSIDAATAWRETGELAALRFAPAGGACVVEVRSLVEVRWSEIVLAP